ncbi:hypothetical protein [Endozoicomonas sp. 4G]|uniref:hypothetical protein n=1 Tax=Endozoicomonas sp. 4G TaxID=2872754 RepID=UPI002078F5F1|nr:hypothetical protein [Endozoicomonas sp. 4G]
MINSLIHRRKASQLIAGSFGLIVMVCPCSTLLAVNPLLTPMDEGWVEKKGTKESDFLSDLININGLSGRYPLVTPNSTHLIFAMNPENERGTKRKHQEESQGAEAQQMQPLMKFPLPVMSREQIAEIIRKLNPGLSEETITALLGNIPDTPPINLAIADLIDEVRVSLGISFDRYQNTILEALLHTQGTESPVKLDNEKDRQNLACLMLAYYTAKKSRTASRQRAYLFFTSFLLHAAEMAGISRLHQQRDKLLGSLRPIKDRELLKENVGKSSSVFSGLKSLETERIKFLEPAEKLFGDLLDPSVESEPVNTLLRDAAKLLNRGTDRNGIANHQRQRKKAQRMLELIDEYGENEPELVAFNNQFFNLIDIIGQMLDPFSAESAELNIWHMECYFRELGESTNFYYGSKTIGKLLVEIRRVIVHTIYHPENKEHELFEKMIEHLKTYLAQQIDINFTNEHHCQVILETLWSGFRELLKQSNYLLAVYSDTAIDSDIAKGAGEKDVSKKEKRKIHLQERINYIKDFVQWLGYYLDIFDYTDSGESDGNNSGTDDVDIPGGVTQ